MELISSFTLIFQLVVIFQFDGLFKSVHCTESRESDDVQKQDLNLSHEVHEAKNLIDTLSFRLHLNLQTLAVHEQRLQQESSMFESQSLVMSNQIKELKKLKYLLNEMTGKKTSICEKFYSEVDFTMAQPIMIDTRGSVLPKHSTVTLQGTMILRCTPVLFSILSTKIFKPRKFSHTASAH